MTTHLTEIPELQRKPHLWRWALVLLALYVFSIGPVCALRVRYSAHPLWVPQWYRYVYGPLEAVATATYCDAWLQDYQMWWIRELCAGDRLEPAA